MKKILLTTDFSDNARNALDYAINLFGLNADYTLLNSFTEPSSTTGVMVSIVEYLQKESKEGLVKQTEELVSAFPGITLSWQSHYGDLAKVVNKLSESETYDYTIIGTKGASSFENFLVGSNTLNVVKTVKMPLMVIPTEISYKEISKIALATDYQHTDQIEVMKPLVDLAELTKAELLIVNVRNADDETNYEEAMEGFNLHNVLEGIDHSFHTKQHDRVVTGIEEFVDEQNVDVLTMVAHKHSFFERLFHKSITKQVSMFASTPLLIIHD